MINQELILPFEAQIHQFFSDYKYTVNIENNPVSGYFTSIVLEIYIKIHKLIQNSL